MPENSFQKLITGYKSFRQKYASGDQSVMQALSVHGQKPQIMVVACCDSRVDPALILQCDPGDLFVVRNVANIVPPYEKDEARHGTSAALEFAVRVLQVKHLVLLGHSQCGGIEALVNQEIVPSDFIKTWVSLLQSCVAAEDSVDTCARLALQQSYLNCMTFPWLQDRVLQDKLMIHLWFFDVKTGQIFTYAEAHQTYVPLDQESA